MPSHMHGCVGECSGGCICALNVIVTNTLMDIVLMMFLCFVQILNASLMVLIEVGHKTGTPSILALETGQW